MAIKDDLETIIDAASRALNLTADIQETKARINDNPDTEFDITQAQLQVSKDKRTAMIGIIKTKAAGLP